MPACTGEISEIATSAIIPIAITFFIYHRVIATNVKSTIITMITTINRGRFDIMLNAPVVTFLDVSKL